MRTPHLQRVHVLQRGALVFFGLLVFLSMALAQPACTERQAGHPSQGRWQLVTSPPRLSGDVLRYDSPQGPSCEVSLRGQAVAPPQALQGAQKTVVATRDGRVMVLPGQGPLWPWHQVQLDGRITAVAVSGAGSADVIAVATETPRYLHLLNGALQSLQRLPLVDRTAKQASSICALLVSAPRQSFVAVFSAMAELWELSYNPLAPEIGLGMVHDFQYREGHFVPGYLHPLRTALPWNAAAAGLDTDGHLVQLQGPGAATPEPLVIHLDVRKRVADVARTAEPLQPCL